MLGSKYSCLSQDRVGITAMDDKEVKGANSVKDQWKLLPQEGPAAEISWIIQLNKLSGKSIWISSSWATVWCVGKSLSWLAGRRWTFQGPSALLQEWAQAAASGTQPGILCWGWGWSCLGGSGCGEQRGQPRAAVPLLWGLTEAVIPAAAPWSSAGWMEQGRDRSTVRARGGRDERGNHNCK